MANHFGLDIGADTIKIVQVVKDKTNWRLVAAGSSKTIGNGLASDSEKEQAILAETIKKLKSESKINLSEVVASIPERAVFSQVIEVPRMGDDELAQAIPWEAENLIPHPLSEVNLDWRIIEDKESLANGKMKVLLVAAPSALVNKCLRILRLAGLEPLAVETETIALHRSLQPIINGNSLVIGNLGAKSLEISVIHQGDLFSTRSLPTAGEALTRAVSSSLSLELPVAEEYKKNYGLSKQLEGKVAAAIEPVLLTVATEFKKAIRFYEEKQSAKIKVLILTGGTALLPGLTEFFAQNLGVEVQIANPLENLSPIFSVALGLAMRDN